MSQNILFLLAVLSGICFGSMSYSYQKGRKQNIPASQIAFVVFLIGAIFFLGYLYYNHLAKGLPPGNPWLAPWQVWVFTIIGGIGQILNIMMIDPAQKRGPSALVFCVMNLVFLPTAIYAVLVLEEKITPLQSLGLVIAIAGILVAGKAQAGSDSGAHTPRSRMDHLLYPIFLMGLMLSSSLATIAMKQLQATPLGSASLFTFNQGLFLFLLYGCGTLGSALILTREGWASFHTKQAFLLGGIAAAGSIGGFLTLCFVAALPGGIGFAITNIICFVTIAFIAAFIFREKRTPAWYLTILLAIVSVILFAMGLT